MDWTEGEWLDFLAEPPHGHNHGRERNQGGGWTTLETDGSVPSVKRFARARKHGTAYTYVRLGCRCVLCQGWKRAYNKKMRNTSR